MIEIHKLGENTTHKDDFVVNRPNGHPVYLLLLIKTPSLFYIDGVWQRFPADCAVIFQPGQMHLYGADNDCYTDCWLHFSSAYVVPEEHFPFGLPIFLHDSEDYYLLFHLIYREFHGVSRRRSKTLDYLASALISKISDAYNNKEYPEIYYRLLHLREDIYRFPAVNRTISEMAESLNISSGYLQNTYPKYFGCTCMNDVIESRIQYSCELLSSTHMSVAEIAEQCGYKNTEHFIRQFKARKNITPGKYRTSQ